MQTYLTHVGQDKGKQPRKGFVKAYRDKLSHHIQMVLGAEEDVKNHLMPELGREFLRACERGNPETLKIFIEHEMPLDYQDPQTGQTALHAAAAAQARQAVRLLVSTRQCDYLIRDKQGRLPSEMAYLYGRDPALARLLGNKERKQAAMQRIKLTRRPVS
jgi:Ankyrin repeats (3 copies)